MAFAVDDLKFEFNVYYMVMLHEGDDLVLINDSLLVTCLIGSVKGRKLN